MTRAHIFRPILNGEGTLLPEARVTVLESDFSVALGQSIYPSITGGAALPNPMTITNGLLDLWLDTPQRVNLLIESADFDPINVYVDALPPAPEVIQTAEPLRIINQASVGKVLRGTGVEGEAAFETYNPNSGWSTGATNARVGGATGTVGFFGSTGLTRPVIDSDAGGNVTLASLLQYLDDLGLISWTGSA